MAQAVSSNDVRQIPEVASTRSAGLNTVINVFRSYPYLVPALIFFIGWQIYPIVYSAYLSFTDDRFLDAEAANWIWFANYENLIRDSLFWKGIARAFVFTAIFVPGMIIFPMVLAVLVDRVINNKVATTYRLILLIPSMIPAPLIFILWSWMYNNYIGPINYFLVDVLGWYTVQTQPQWINDQNIVFISIAIMEWWWGLGYHTMFFLAGLATIPRDLFDAARVDGASEWRMFWGVTFFRLLPIILVLVVIRFGTAMAVIDEYLIMGGFSRGRNTYTWTVYMYETAFGGGMQLRGYAAAIGWLGALFMLVVVIGMFWVFRSRD